MKNLLLLLLVVCGLSACKVGDFPENRRAMYEMGQADCEKTPERCVQGYPW